ncbi:MAG: dihydrodipicolinate synthase family protein [Deltaproteobacteria bacterium]|nr:dihydrodipicolinate synthase family protein [Candidatus Anaeroferrophillus wilburensis]MBN2887917.1 dihydrodipicolinate synthase family protein [Deltaproteobacteria bacterium]
MTVLNFDGIIPPIPTPFKDGRLACDHLAANVERWCQSEIVGLLALGSNGEYVYLSPEEKLKLVATVASAAPGDRTILAGTGCESTGETIRLTRACADRGAHVALVVTPCYYGGQMVPDVLIRHYETLADQSPIPILLYNVEKFTHVNLDPPIVARLSRHQNIIGIKDSSGNVAQLGAYLNQVEAGFKVLVGTASALYPALALGCDGGILALANVAPHACVAIHRLVRRGDHEAARQLQLTFLALNQAVTARYGVPGLKAALEMVGYYGGEPRPPLLPLAAADCRILYRIMADAGLELEVPA